MTNDERSKLEHIVLAPYIQKATTLIRKQRKGGGNMYRHCFYVMGVLIDYHYIDSIMLKSAILHDIIEDCPEFEPNEIIYLDGDGHRVYEVVLELSKKGTETKIDYLEGLKNISRKAKIIKCADRISNLVDVNIYTLGLEKTKKLISQTKNYILPLAKEVNENMFNEINDLVKLRNDLVNFYEDKLCPYKTRKCREQ